MIKWCLSHWKWGLPVLLIPLALLIRGFGSLAGLLRRLPPDESGPSVTHFDPQKSEAARERIIDARESEDKRIITEADRERESIDTWIDDGLGKK